MPSELLARGGYGATDATVRLVGASIAVSTGEHEREVLVDEAWLTVTPPDLSFHLVLAALLTTLSVTWLIVAEEHGVESLFALAGIAVAALWVVWAIRRLRWTVTLGTRREFAVFSVSLSQKKSWEQLEAHLATASAVTRAWRRETGLIGDFSQSLRLISDPSEKRLRALWREEKPILSFTDWAPVRLRRAWAFVLLSGAAPLLTGLAVVPRFGIGGAVLAAPVAMWLGSWVGQTFLLQLEASEGAIETLRPMFPDPKAREGR